MRQNLPSERGSALVETALVSMFLVLLVTGIADLGRAIYTSIALRDAAQEAAHFASFEDEVGGASLAYSHVVSRAIASIDRPALTTDQVSVSCVTDTTGSRDTYEVSVTITHDVEMITPIVDGIVGTITLSKTATAERFLGNCPVNDLGGGS